MPRYSVLLWVLISFLCVFGSKARAEHIIGGEIYWECLHDGPDAGKFVFYLKLYRDCSVQNTIISENGHALSFTNHPDINSQIVLDFVSVQEVVNSCGMTCGTAASGDISVSEYLFSSGPIEVNGVPPAGGYEIVYHRCCRNGVDNLVNPNNQEVFLLATMYPFEGMDLNPCYDSSPQFAEVPMAALCAGSELYYSGLGADADGDSISYQFVSALGDAGSTIPYVAGYGFDEPLPGPSLDSAYDLIALDPVTGMIHYQSDSAIQGKWNVNLAMETWRCGRLISRTARDMTVAIYPCAEENAPPQIMEPVWLIPSGVIGNSVTVAAGDTVSFLVQAQDLDSVGGVPQSIAFNAFGEGFGAYYTDADSGCVAGNCATLSGDVPPLTVSGMGSATEFNWVTSCGNVLQTNSCASNSYTYNFVFKYSDDFCPINESSYMSVSVTVVSDPIIPSPTVHCIDTDTNGDVTITWTPTLDTNSIPLFTSYVVEHSLDNNGPFTVVGELTNINASQYVHSSTNPVVAPVTNGVNYYRIRTRSGCNDQAVDAAETARSIYLELENEVVTAELSWTSLSVPLPASSLLPYQIYREYPAGSWNLIGTTSGNSYTDSVSWNGELINYRVELPDTLSCVSRSNAAGAILDGLEELRLHPPISIYPNPSNGANITVSNKDGSLLDGSYRVVDFSGHVIQQGEVFDYLLNLNLAQFASGIYVLHLSTDQQNHVGKLIIAN